MGELGGGFAQRAMRSFGNGRRHAVLPVLAVVSISLVGASLSTASLGAMPAWETSAPPTATAIIAVAAASTPVVTTAGTAIPIAEPTIRPTPVPTPTPEPTSTPLPTQTPIPEFSLHVPILTYHVIAPWSVGSAYSQPGLDVDPSLFDRQLAALTAHGWQAITVDQLEGYLAAKKRPPRKTFVISIDDGYADGFTYALPILQKYGFAATYYVVAGRVGSGYCLDWGQVAQLKAAGMEIGNHTMDHVNLTSLSSAEIAQEIGGAQQLIADHVGAAPTTFAYPFGSWNTTVARAVRAAGLTMAVTTADGALETWSGRYHVPRIAVSSSLSPADLLAKIAPYA